MKKIYLKLMALALLSVLSVTQLWADATNWKVKGTGTGLNGWDDKNTALTQGSTNTNVWYRQVSNTCEFKVVGSSGAWGDNEKNGNDHLESNNSINTAGVFNNGGNFRCTRSGTWYICYSTSSGKVYGTTANPDAPVTYTVTYNGNGKTSGSVPTDASSPYTSGSTVTVKGNTGSLAKTGYHFVGWNTAADYSGTNYAAGATFSISANTTLYAKWVRTIYVYDNLTWNSMKLYTWDSNNGNKTYNGGWSGQSLSQIGSTKWYQVDIVSGPNKLILNNGSDQTHDIEIDNYTPTITDGHSYETWNDNGTKKLREKKFTVSFNMKSHGSAVSSQNIYYNGLVTEPSPAPSATGYTFGGWYKETGCTNAWNFGSDRITAARTLYAKWTAKNYTITYNLNGGTQQVSPAPATSYTIESSAITLPTPSKDGYNFDGWFDNSSFTGSAITTIAAGSTGNKEYWAKWSTASTYYDVTFGVHASGHGTLAAVKTATSAAITSGDDLLSGTAITFTATPSSYYEVDAWYTNSACTTGEHDAGETTYSVASLGSDIVVYVKFKPTTYTITYNLNSGTNNPGNPSTYTYESSAITLQDPTRDGYTFGGWYTEVGLVNRVYSIAAGSNGNKAFWAKWTEKKSTVTVNANQTSMGTLKFGSTSKSWGTTASVGVTTTQGITATASSGYIFSRWVLSGGAATSSSLTSGTITLKGNGTGADGIAKAVFGKKYYYRGGKNSWGATQMTCHESGYYAYYSASSGEHEFKITPNSGDYIDACNTFDNSYGNITLTHKDDGYGGLNVKCPGATAHYICILYPNTTVNDGANPVIFASTTLPDLAPETTYATTFYAGDHGAINAKGTAIAKNGNASVNIGSTARALTATPESGYSFDYWETSGSVTVADIYSASTTVTASAAGGTVTAHYLANSGWYLQGGFDNYDTWETSAKNLPVDRPYRGISGVYYRPFSTLDNGDYFGMHDGTNKYSGHTATDKNYDYNSLDQVATLYVNSSQSFQAKTSFSNKWAVIKTTGTKKFWIQSPATYYTLSVTSANGTVTLTENNYGGLETNQFASGDRVNISVTASSGYWIDDITIGETSVATNVNASTYSGYTTMPSGAATLTVTYNRYYTLTYDANYYTSGTGGTAPSASSYVSGSNVTVVGKGDLTMTNYTFSGWNTDPHITGTNYAEGANIEMTGNITLYGVWKRTIPFELEDADPEFVMATVYGTYNCTTLTDYDNPTKDGYTFGGWWTNIAGGDNYVISPEKELQPGVYHWTNYDNKTNEFMRKPSSESSLFAKWTQTVTLNANLANHGSGTDKSASVTYKKNALTSITHCTPAAGYELDGYYTAATGGTKILNANGTYAGTNVSDNEEAYIVGGVWKHAGATILYAQYSEIMRTVAVTVNNAYLGTVSTASLTDVGPATASAEVTATPTPGATLTNWTLPSGVTAAATYSATSNPISVNATAAGKTITANFTETMHTVTLTNDNSTYGTVNTSSPLSVGQITAVQIQATPKSGYMFSKWVKTAGAGTVTYYTGAGNGQVTDASGDEKEITYICVTGNVTLKATWEPDRSSGYVVYYGNDGKNADGGTDASQARAWKDGKLYRPTTEESNTSSFTFTAGVADVNKVIEFKIHKKTSPEAWYGYNSAEGGKIDGSISNVALNTSYGNGRVCIIMPGSYTFTWNKSNNQLSISYPNDVYYVRGGFNSWGWSHPMTETSSGVYSATVNMTEANHTYSGDAGFKVLIAGQYYGKNGTTFTRISSTGSATVSECSTSGANMGLTTDYTGNYTFTYNTDGNQLQITYPTAYKVTYGKGSVDGSASNCSAVDIDNSSAAVTSNSTWVKSGNRVVLTAPEAKEGYTYNGWFNNNSGSGEAITTAANCTITVTSAATYYACYSINNHTITHSAATNGSYTIKVGSMDPVSTNTTADYAQTITLAATPATGYHFGSWTVTKSPSGSVTVTSNQFTMPDADVTVAAAFAANNYTITLNNHGATTAGTTSVSVTYNATTGLTSDITVPEKDGYTFGGYYTEEGGSGTQLINASGKWQKGNAWINAGGNWVNAGDVELHAKWTANNYTVTFDATTNGGTCDTHDKEVTFGSAYGELPTAVHSGDDSFLGWYTTASGEGSLVTEETIVSIAGNHTLYARFETTFEVVVQFKCGSDVLYPETRVNASLSSLTPTITAPDILGYAFSSWTETGGSSYVTFDDASASSTTINASGAATVVANYTVVPTVYFKNNLGWDSVFVTFDCSFIAGKQNVPSNNGHPYFAMTQLGSTDVYYCAIPDTIVANNYAKWKWNIAFDNTNYGKTATSTHTGTWDFYGGECVGRGDFDPKATMFIPYNGDTETRNTATFYKTGCWIKYNSTDPGYQVKVNTWVTGTHADTCTVALSAPVAGGYEFSGKVWLKTNNYGYGFKLYKDYQKNNTDLYYSNKDKIQSSTTTLPWAFATKIGDEAVTADTRRCELYTEAKGDYEFTVSFATGKPMINVTYPVSAGDYRLVYKDRATWSGAAHSASWCHPSRVIKAKANAEDIVSFYIAYGSSPSILLQQCTSIDGSGNPVWNAGSAVTVGATAKGIYNYKVAQNADKEATVTFDGEYKGDFYVRTDASDGGWSNYKTSGTNLMTYSEYAETEHDYTHYFMRFVTAGSNIKFCIANDYSECISDTLVSDTYTNEWLEAYANVRFMWNKGTNVVSRAYISGSSNVSDRFLVLEGSVKMFDENGNELTTGNGRIAGLNEYEMKFIDDQNWIYEATIKAKPGAKALLTAKYNGKIQYFGGSGPLVTDSVLLLGGSDTNKYKIRVVYDFKTNRLIKAFIPDGDIGTNLAIDADLMIIRDHQADAQQVTFTGSGKLSDVKTVYGAMMFNKYTVNNKERTGTHGNAGLSRYTRDLFYISFPFDVKLSDVFGFGTYGKHWILEYYDGKGRAANGFWADSDPNWKFVMPSQRNSFTMKAFEGYILALDLDEMTESSPVWNNNVENVYIYFPSSAEVEDIEATNRLIEIDQDGYECTINRPTPDGDRRVKDSYWHCIGVPSFANYNRDLTVEDGGATIDWRSTSMPYLYEVNWSSNTLNVTSSATFNFKATWSYLVQYAGATIYWSEVNVTPASIVARERKAPTNAEFRIELQKAGEKADQTFVRLTEDENVTNGFDFNYDLSKEFNKNQANIYTLVTTVKEGAASVTQSAANVLPMTEQTTVIPVGVKIAATGDYTFAIPEGTNGVGVTLIDNETGIQTPLSALDYTVNLSAGTYDGRFVLEISPIMQTPTGIEEVMDDGSQIPGARKMLIDGLLYIVKDGKMFDAQGRQVK